MDRRTKQVATRRALVDAAYRLFADRGFEATTVEDITDAAGVSRRTFFRYFPSKESVIFSDALATLDRLVDAIARVERLDLPTAAAVVADYFERIEDDERFRLRLVLMRDNRGLDDGARAFRGELRERLATALRDRRQDLTAMDVEILSALIAMLTTTVARRWSELAFQPSMRELIETAAATLARFTTSTEPRVDAAAPMIPG